MSYRASIIQSIQYGTVTVANGNATGTATITAVTTTASAVQYLGASYDSADVNISRSAARLTLTDATTVTATRIGTTGALSVAFVVIAFYPSVVKSLQAGVVTLAASPATTTISAVTVAKTWLVWGGSTTTHTTYTGTADLARLTLTNTTTVTGVVETLGGTTAVAGFTAVEFK